MPLAAIALGAMAVGTGLQIAGNEKAKSAMNAARAAETSKQSQLQQEADAAYQKSLSQSGKANAQAQMAKGEAQRVNAWEALQKAGEPVASALPATTGATAKASQRAGSAADTWNALNAKAAAREGSYGDWQNQQDLKNSEANRQISVLNNFSRADSNLLPTELQVASQAGDKLSGWGQIVQALGGLTYAANSAGVLNGLGPTGVSATQSAQVAAEMAGQGLPGMAGSAVGSGGVAGGYDSIPTNIYG